MAARTPGRDDHEVCQGGLSLQFDKDQVLGFIVFENVAKRIGDRSDFFDRDAFGGLGPGSGG
jgi:hypothetical protein